MMEAKDKKFEDKNEKHDILEASDKNVKDENENHEKDENENQKGKKAFMTPEQEIDILEQFSKIVLGTWRPNED